LRDEFAGLLDGGCFALADGPSACVDGGKHLGSFLNFFQLNFLKTLPDFFTIDTSKPGQFLEDFGHAHADTLRKFVAGGKSPGSRPRAAHNSSRLPPALNMPGEILRNEFLAPMDLSLSELARRMGCGPMRISEIVRGKRSITAETSILLGHALGVSPAFWPDIQMDHDLALAALALEKKAA